MPPKAKVCKTNGQWMIRKPRYGFHHEPYRYFGPYETFADAVRVAFTERPVSTGAGGSMERGHTPDSYWWPEIWPTIIMS